MTKNKVLLVLLLITNSSTFFSQTKEELKFTAERDARFTSAATLAGDFKTVIKHTYPTVVEFMGGTETAVGLIENMFAEMGEQGFSFEKADVQFVSDVVFEQDEYRCYTQSENHMRMNDVRIISKSYLLGIYDAEKEIWYFIEAAKMKDKALMDELFPGFKTALNIPADETKTEEIKD